MNEKIFSGIGVSDGIRIGKAFVLKKPAFDTGRDITQDQAEAELSRFDKAVKKAGVGIDALIEKMSGKLKEEELEIIKGQKTFLSDPAYCPQIRKLISEKLYAPEKAVLEITNKYTALFENMDNSYMRERATDVRDCGNRLLNILGGGSFSELSEINHPVILIADDLSPSDTVQLDRNMILAFATRKGGKTSHTSIFAKSLAIPAVVGIAGIMDEVSDNDDVILDGGKGTFIVSPKQVTLKEYKIKIEKEQKINDTYNIFAHKNAVAKDGKRITVAANIGSYDDAAASLKMGAEAVGLFRTEQVYLSSSEAPDENTQFEIYKKIAQCYSPKEVIIRTLDAGGDKNIKYLGIPEEANPFLGYRAIRVCLNRKDLFLTQLRAILRAGVYGKLSIMFPMISEYDELVAAKKLLEEAKMQLKSEGIPFNDSVRIGIMVEIPSAAVMADVFAKEVDFFSIGTNDLVQYSLAVDRGNEKLSYLYSYFNPAVIRTIKHVSEESHSAGINLGMCGAMAGDPLAIPILIGLGLDELSMAAGSIAQSKYIISKLDTKECCKLANEAVSCKTTDEVRKLVKQYSSRYKMN